MTPRPITVHAAGLLLVAALLRLWGLDFGLPLLSNPYIRPDESLTLVGALQLLRTPGNPQMFSYPAAWLWLEASLFQVLYFLRNLTGLTDAHPIAADFTLNYDAYTLGARALSALVGTLTVWRVIRLTAHLAKITALPSRRAGLIAGWLYALAPLAVRESHFATVDTLLTLFTFLWLERMLLLSSHPCNRVVGNGSLALLFAALAAATKYNLLILTPLTWIWLAWLLRNSPRRLRFRLFILALCIPPLAWAALNPFVLIDPAAYLQSFRELHAVLSPVQDGRLISSPIKLLFRPLYFLRHGPGGAAGVMAACLGFILLWRTLRSRIVFWLILSAALALYLPLAATRILPFRYLLPLMPLMASLAALASAWLLRQPGRARTLAMPLLAWMLTVTACRSARLDYLLMREDTRTLAGRWIAQHVPPTVPVVLQVGPEAEPQLPETQSSLRRRLDHNHRLHGARSASIVNQLHQLRLQYGAADAAGYEIYRQPETWPRDADLVCVVTADHPLVWGRTPPADLIDHSLPVIQSATFKAFEPRSPRPLNDRDFDRSDAFFLPISPLATAYRPGPHLTVTLIDISMRSERPQVQ